MLANTARVAPRPDGGAVVTLVDRDTGSSVAVRLSPQCVEALWLALGAIEPPDDDEEEEGEASG